MSGARADLQVTQMHVPSGVIDLGIGQPEQAILPLAELAHATNLATSAPDGASLQYGLERGSPILRTALATFLTQRYGVEVRRDGLMISGGNSQALDLCCTALASAGDVVFVEEPTYAYALRMFADHNLRVIGIAVDEHGLRLDRLEAALKEHRPRFVYTIPTGHNPTGVSMPTGRRRRLVELAAENGFTVVSDDVYQMLDYTGSVPEAMAAHVGSGRVISLGTFSKILAPGLRLGWIQADAATLAHLETRGQLVSGGGLSPFISSLIAPILADGSVDRYLDGVRGILATRRATMLQALHDHCPPGVRFRSPDAGYFVWLQLPDGIDAQALRPVALAAGVGYQPGPVFSTAAGQSTCLRLAFSYYDEASIRSAVEALGAVLTDAIDRAGLANC